ncbi:MAG: hypothetical protein WDM88_13470 [Galbitalea sp.]
MTESLLALAPSPWDPDAAYLAFEQWAEGPRAEPVPGAGRGAHRDRLGQ